jgi:hypothetical protein
MKTIKIVTKKITLPTENNDISVNDINIDDIVEKFSDEFIIDLEKYMLTQIKQDLFLVLLLRKKN